MGVCNPSLSPNPFCKMGVRCPRTGSSASLQNQQLSTRCPTQRLCRQGARAWHVQQGQSRDGIKATYSHTPMSMAGWGSRPGRSGPGVTVGLPQDPASCSTPKSQGGAWATLGHSK